MKVEIRHSCEDFDSYRAARVKSLFNVESGANFALDAELPIADPDWRIGVIVGPSGSGKTSLGARLGRLYAPRWPKDAPIIDAIAPDGHFDQVTGALSAVGLGSVPSWLRPYPVLSNGERFRATLARLVCDAPPRAVVDEFSSVVDRQIAKVGAGAGECRGRSPGQRRPVRGPQCRGLRPPPDGRSDPRWVRPDRGGSFSRLHHGRCQGRHQAGGLGLSPIAAAPPPRP